MQPLADGLAELLADRARWRAEAERLRDEPRLPAARVEAEPLGWIVLIREPTGLWADSWDGAVHATLEAGRASLAEAIKRGFDVVLVTAVPVSDEPVCTCGVIDVSIPSERPGTRTKRGYDPACPVHGKEPK